MAGTQVAPSTSIPGQSSGAVPPVGLYGNGGGGAFTVVGTFTQTTEQQYSTLTVSATGRYKANGWRVFVRDTLTIEAGGILDDDGNNATGATQGAALALRNYLGGAAGAGGAGRVNVTGNGNAGGGSGGNSAPNDTGAAPTGGAGGNGSPAYLGGAGGGAAAPIIPQP